jgi:hypothetical protein
VRARILILVVAASTACAGSESVQCEDGTFCPAGSRCAADGVCLVEADSCAGFGDNAPCDLEGEAGFCAGASATCEAGVAVSGRLIAQAGGGVPDLAVTGLDRPWMSGDTTDSTGLFEVVAVRADPDLVIAIAGNQEFAPIRTRGITLGSEPYEINGRAAEGLRTFRHDKLLEMTEMVGLEHDAGTGTIAVQVGRAAGNPIGGATVEIEGDGAGAGRVLYFAGDGSPAPGLSETAQGAGAALLLEVAPGSYRLTANHPMASRCAGAGADQPDPVELEVVAGEISNAGWFICEMAEAAPISGRARSRSPRSSGRSAARRSVASPPRAAD